MANDWLADIVVVNESRDEAVAGDVCIYRSAGEACGALEHWWVEGNEGFVFTASGTRLMLGVDEKKRVIVAGRQDAPAGQEVVLTWLHSTATALLDTRRASAEKGKAALGRSEQQGRLPSSVEGLIAYIGFSK
jgi:hypothetical protein